MSLVEPVSKSTTAAVTCLLLLGFLSLEGHTVHGWSYKHEHYRTQQRQEVVMAELKQETRHISVVWSLYLFYFAAVVRLLRTGGEAAQGRVRSLSQTGWVRIEEPKFRILNDNPEPSEYLMTSIAPN